MGPQKPPGSTLHSFHQVRLEWGVEKKKKKEKPRQKGGKDQGDEKLN